MKYKYKIKQDTKNTITNDKEYIYGTGGYINVKMKKDWTGTGWEYTSPNMEGLPFRSKPVFSPVAEILNKLLEKEFEAEVDRMALRKMEEESKNDI